MSTWESRMAQRAKRAAIKRRLRQNLESGSEPEEEYSRTSVLFAEGFEPITVEHWALIPRDEEEEWPDVVGAEG